MTDVLYFNAYQLTCRDSIAPRCVLSDEKMQLTAAHASDLDIEENELCSVIGSMYVSLCV